MRQELTPELPLVAKFRAEEAIQGVAVDDRYFYAINNTAIGKYERNTGRKVGAFKSTPEIPLIHMDGGMTLGGKLYCSHSNFPDVPMLSSVEIYDCGSLRHIRSHSFGHDAGSMVWVDWHDNSWWICFGHYNGRGGEPGKPNTLTTLVRYDREWRKQGAYSFPPDLVTARWDGMTASGGVWGPGGSWYPRPVLYVTTHHAPEFYIFRLPRAGTVLELLKIVKSPAEGQGLAIDARTRRLFQIQRRERTVYEFDLTPLLRG
ncbi:MAG: hypothetical protein SFU56_03205 [Capsulimonadales bacterium]|nr:hypothetical protein [Capsulimonadales bacterium]